MTELKLCKQLELLSNKLIAIIARQRFRKLLLYPTELRRHIFRPQTLLYLNREFNGRNFAHYFSRFQSTSSNFTKSYRKTTGKISKSNLIKFSQKQRGFITRTACGETNALSGANKLIGLIVTNLRRHFELHREINGGINGKEIYRH